MSNPFRVRWKVRPGPEEAMRYGAVPEAKEPRGESFRRGFGEAADVADLAGALPWASGEEALVTELQAGSDEAFDWLVTHYHGPVYSLLYGMLGDSADAADVSQEVFLKAFKGIRSFRCGSSLKTWLYRIAVREGLNHRRWSWRHLRQQVSIDAEGGQQQSIALELEDDGASPFDQMASGEVQAVVHRSLAAVPKIFRTAVILRDLEGLSYEEVAEVLEVSVGTVKSRILRGRRALKEVLEPFLNGHRPHSAVRACATPSGARHREMGNILGDMGQEHVGGGE